MSACLRSPDARCRPRPAPRQIPDHGDLWRVGMEDVERIGTLRWMQATLRGECFSLPLELERCLELSETDKGWQLRLNIR